VRDTLRAGPGSLVVCYWCPIGGPIGVIPIGNLLVSGNRNILFGSGPMVLDVVLHFQ
jgi:hypothetical protein